MGNFLSATAFHLDTVDAVVTAVSAAAAARQVQVEWLLKNGARRSHEDAMVYAPVGAWTVVIWPTSAANQLPRAVSVARGVLVSTVYIHDDDLWGHTCYRGTTRLHDYSSAPDYFEGPRDCDDDYHARVRASRDPMALALAFGVPASTLAPYLVAGAPRAPDRRAHADDEFTVGDIWVFVDFWRRLGITFPNDVKPVGFLRFPPGYRDW